MSAQQTTTYGGSERRAVPRARISCGVVAGGATADGQEFEVKGILLDLSTGGLLARLQHPVEPGSWMVFYIDASADGSVGPYAPVRGVVVRAEGRPDGTCDVAARFTHPLWGMPGECESSILCAGCGRILGVTDGREARFADIIFSEAVVVPCPGCGRVADWRPGRQGRADAE